MDDDENIVTFIQEFYPSSCWGKCCKRRKYALSSSELRSLNFLRLKVRTKYDSKSLSHQQILLSLWSLSFDSPPELISAEWVKIGFQGQDPSTDFRGGGLFSLQQMIYFAESYPSFYQEFKSADYSFAICSINLSHFLMYFFQLLPKKSLGTSDSRRANPWIMKIFARLNESDQGVIHFLHAVGIVFMHRHWNQEKATKNVTVMDFIQSLLAGTRYIEQLLENNPSDLNHLKRLTDILQ